jgi:hypothetical protein
MSKYHNRKITRDGMTFDSVKEYKRFCELSLLQKAGAITDLQTQVKFELIPAQYEIIPRFSEKTGKRLKDGKKCIEKAVSYYADFVYIDKEGHVVVEDTKGMKTEKYIIKRKLMLHLYGIRIKEV